MGFQLSLQFPSCVQKRILWYPVSMDTEWHCFVVVFSDTIFPSERGRERERDTTSFGSSYESAYMEVGFVWGSICAVCCRKSVLFTFCTSTSCEYLEGYDVKL